MDVLYRRCYQLPQNQKPINRPSELVGKDTDRKEKTSDLLFLWSVIRRKNRADIVAVIGKF